MEEEAEKLLLGHVGVRPSVPLKSKYRAAMNSFKPYRHKPK
jgi:hypothetical protein